ncbi:unnamed protein product [Eruca vesicaria subsp. sativa]|uniref:Late embryogenesis abundant protein LEA-2 subgroup domain-containing protein n=1 Tax=Eruca vesicaria subsp. sativa TaxID=29727 RepID=A0ABC8KXZ7_ERUVS|nr:unnamed protein product [Eruca vesicaria subsp. sativa]
MERTRNRRGFNRTVSEVLLRDHPDLREEFALFVPTRRMGIEEGHHKGERMPLIIRCRLFFEFFILLCLGACFIGLMVYMLKPSSLKEPVPKIELASMDFTVLNISDTRLSAKWDMSIRIPDDLPGDYICFQGDLQASFMYKNVTLATSSQEYNNLQYRRPQVLRVSASVSGEDIDGLIGKDITADIKEKKDVRFGTRFYLTDCREKTSGTMRYVKDLETEYKAYSIMKSE